MSSLPMACNFVSKFLEAKCVPTSEFFIFYKNSRVHILHYYVALWDLGQRPENGYVDMSAASGLDKDRKNPHVNLDTKFLWLPQS